MATTLSIFLPSLTPLTVQPCSQLNLPPKYKLNHLKNNDQTTLDETKQIHGHLLRTNFQSLYENHFSFFRLHVSTAARYNFLITSYNNYNQPTYGLNIYVQMREMDFGVDSFILASLLKSCGQVGLAWLGREIHGFTLKHGLDYDVFVCNTLIQMYGECESAESARLVFDMMYVKDAVSWSTMIRTYSKQKMFTEALGIIREMQYNLVRPSDVAMISIVSLLADIADTKEAKSVHAYVIKNSSKMANLSASLATSLIDMYAKSGNLALARHIFDRLEEKGIVSYTAMVAGYIRGNQLKEGAKLFAQMMTVGNSPNEVTLLSLVTECARIANLEWGKQLHAYVLRNGYDMTPVLGTSLVDMYGKCNEVKSAQFVFDTMERRDIMAWTSLISAYAQGNCINEAIDLLIMMRENDIRPNHVTTVSLLSLCTETGTLDHGRWIHAYIDKQGVKADVVLTTALIDMYAKCGDIATAYKLFDKATSRDISMWNSMITGFGIHGFGKEALKLFADMEKSQITPNYITFVALLNACSHAGLVMEGKMVFQTMLSKYCLAPQLEHYGCMVDLLGRAGLLHESYEMILNMPMEPNAIVWGALLATCKVHKDANLGAVAGRNLLVIDPDSCGHNVLISNIYATEQRWSDVASVRTAIRKRGMKKEPGISCIEVNGTVHEFTTADQAHPQHEKINSMLEEMFSKLKEAGYKPDTSVVLY